MSREAGLNKAPDAFRTISEVAEELDLPQHVLRFWESRFPHIKPLKRGGGRRYYRPEDIDLLRGIRRLLYSDGYTIKGVQRILREQGVRTVQSVGQGHALTPVAPSQDGELAADDLLAPLDDHPADDAVNESSGPDASLPVRPQNGPIPDANPNATVPISTTLILEEAPAELDQTSINGLVNRSVAAPCSADQVAAAAAVVKLAPSAYAGRGHAGSGMAALDLERLKRALSELEACRRLLEKALEGTGDPDLLHAEEDRAPSHVAGRRT